jgi:hypothetical protein|tara:strand:+ start:64 stop:171 length:108 start_codon:yes stop_codon:yes gene_type:complete
MLYEEQFGKFDFDNYDASDADVIVQLAVLGEVMFG